MIEYLLKKNMVTIMKESTVKILDDKDMEFVETLRSLGVPRNVATLITFLANVDEASSREIEMGSDLRQPEVSIAMRNLRENNWIEEREIKREGKGRPMKVYSLRASIDEIIKHYEQQKLNESAQAMESIQRLKELISS
jgi:predicted transcriptional regulator